MGDVAKFYVTSSYIIHHAKVRHQIHAFVITLLMKAVSEMQDITINCLREASSTSITAVPTMRNALAYET